MKLLVTGGAGFIGSHLVRRLVVEQGHDVVNLDALTYSGNPANVRDLEGHPQYTFHHGDICDRQVVTALLADHRIEGVINCAAESHVDRSILDPGTFAQTNVVGTTVLLEAARQAGVQRFLQVSTDEVYGNVTTGSSYEEGPLAPGSPYAASKAAGDLLACSYWTTFRFPVMITRGCNAYGTHQHPEKLTSLFVTNAIDDQLLPLYGDGRHRRHWLAVQDHCAAIEHVFLKGEPGLIYNVGGGDERDNLTIAEQILTVLGKPRTLLRFVRDRPGHDRRYAMNCDRLHRLGWKPTVAFDEELTTTIRWYQEHEAWWRPIKAGEFQRYYREQYRTRLA
jgi:dTDP-glucose 4,6-dehydratase